MSKFTNMSSKEKVDYIWDYYKIPIIAVLIIIVSLVSFIHSQATKINYIFNFTVLSTTIQDDKKENFEKELTALLVKNKSKIRHL